MKGDAYEKLQQISKEMKGSPTWKIIEFLLYSKAEKFHPSSEVEDEEADLKEYPRMIVDYDDVEALGRAGIPLGIKSNQKHRTDKYGVPFSEGYEG